MFKKLISYQFILLLLITAHTSCSQHIKTPAGYGLWAVDISHDDKYIALGGDDSLLRIFTIDLTPYKTIGAGGMIRAVHWHPKENLLAVSSRNNIWILKPESGEEIKLEGQHNGSRAVA